PHDPDDGSEQADERRRAADRPEEPDVPPERLGLRDAMALADREKVLDRRVGDAGQELAVNHAEREVRGVALDEVAGAVEVSAPEQESDLLRDRGHARAEAAQRPHALARDRERDHRAEQQRIGRVVALPDQVEERHRVREVLLAPSRTPGASARSRGAAPPRPSLADPERMRKSAPGPLVPG